MQSSEFQPSCQEHTVGKGWPLQQTPLGKLDIHLQNNVIGSLYLTQKSIQNALKT